MREQAKKESNRVIAEVKRLELMLKRRRPWEAVKNKVELWCELKEKISKEDFIDKRRWLRKPEMREMVIYTDRSVEGGVLNAGVYQR